MGLEQSVQTEGRAGENFRLRVGTVAGAADGWWSQVHHFSPAEAEKMGCRGEMVVLISFRAAEAAGVDVVAVGRELLGRMNEEYYGIVEGSVWERLSAAVERVGREAAEEHPLLAKVLEEGGEAGEPIKVEEVNVVAGVLWRGAWYAAGFGRGSGVWICRGGEVGLVLGSGRPSPEATDGRWREESWSGSGWVNDGDIFLLGTKRFFELVGTGVIKAALSAGSVEEAVGSLTPVVHGTRGGEGATAALVGVEGLPDYRPLAQVETPVATVVEKPAQVAETLGKKIGGLLGRLSLPKRSVYIRMYQPPALGRRGTLALGVVLLVVILGSVMFGVKRQREKDLAAGPVGRTEVRIAQARDLVSLSPERAKALLDEAKTTALTVQDKKKREELLSQIGALSDQASGVTRAVASTFMDLRLVRDGLSVKNSFLDEGGVWWGLDTNSERLVMVVTAKKQADVVAGKDSVGGGRLVAAAGGKAYVFGTNGTVEVDPKQGKTRVVAAADKDWGEVVGLGSFGGNLYLLDLGAGVWRYPVIEGGFGGKQRWFGAGVKPDLKEAVGMAIDGSVWIGFKDGRVLKFTQGARDSFSMPTLEQPIGGLAAIFTTTDSTNLYLLDSENGRVIVVSKKGEYVRQYVASELKGTMGLSVDEGAGKAIYVTAGEKILEIKL